jgi:hypothetical protein
MSSMQSLNHENATGEFQDKLWIVFTFSTMPMFTAVFTR